MKKQMKKLAGMIGFPDDEAVCNNNGRPGAKDGPVAFRKAFKKLNGKNPVQEVTSDEGNIRIYAGEIAKSHEEAANRVKQIQENYGFSLVIGGGHDYAFPHLKGVKTAYPTEAIGCINIDPHYDLRPPKPVILSGSPFYMAIDQGVIEGKDLVEFGIQTHCNAENLWEYANDQSVKTVMMDDLRFGKSIEKFRTSLNQLEEQSEKIVLSLDLDSIQAAFAPGVSAPAMEGFDPSEVLEMIRIAANCEKVTSLGIYELNPKYDIDNRTARLAATVGYHFLHHRFFMD